MTEDATNFFWLNHRRSVKWQRGEGFMSKLFTPVEEEPRQHPQPSYWGLLPASGWKGGDFTSMSINSNCDAMTNMRKLGVKSMANTRCQLSSCMIRIERMGGGLKDGWVSDVSLRNFQICFFYFIYPVQRSLPRSLQKLFHKQLRQPVLSHTPEGKSKWFN